MPSELPLNKDDLNKVDWVDVVEKSKEKRCLEYYQNFLEKSNKAEENKNYREKEVFYLLAVVSGVAIKPKETEQLFAENFKNLIQEHRDFLIDIAHEISDPELQARIADILWVIQKDFKMAQLAISAYLKSAKVLEDPKHWNPCFERIERALRLSFKIKHQYDDVIEHIESVLDKYNGKDPLFLSAKLMDLLQEHKRGDIQKYASLAENAANLAESNLNWEKARMLWHIKATWHRMENKKYEEFSASFNAAETYIKQAEKALLSDSPPNFRAQHLMEQAIQKFREIRSINNGNYEDKNCANKREEEIHKWLIECQEESYKAMPTITTPKVDISDLIEYSKNTVRGKSIHEAILNLTTITKPTDINSLEQMVKKNANDFVLDEFFPKVNVNQKGKTVTHQKQSIFSNDSEESSEALHFEMCSNACFYYYLTATGVIEPAREQIILEHNIREEGIQFIISNSPFIPPERKSAFARGLYSGFLGDFFTSIHILIPQIENSIRVLLWRNGIITSGYSDQRIQDEHNLNSILYYDNIDSIFDKNTLFDLRCLLVERAGHNLRNRIAHGLIDDYEFRSSLMSYIWWFTLRLCCLPIINGQNQQSTSNPDLS